MPFFIFVIVVSSGKFVMYEIDAVWAGLLGGFIGSFIVAGVLYFNFYSRYREFFFNKEQFKNKTIIKKLEDDVMGLKMQVAALHVAAGVVDKKKGKK
jgi:hypothetical protein